MSKFYLTLLFFSILVYSGKCGLICEDLIASGKSEEELIDEISTRMDKMKNELSELDY